MGSMEVGSALKELGEYRSPRSMGYPTGDTAAWLTTPRVRNTSQKRRCVTRCVHTFVCWKRPEKLHVQTPGTPYSAAPSSLF